MKELQRKIIDQIKEKEIQPIPKPFFVFKNLTVWVLAIVSIILGATSSSLLAYNIANQDWNIYTHLGESFWGFLVSALPYLWIVSLIAFLSFAIFNIEKSKKGYRYSPFLILFLSIGITIILGAVGYFAGIGAKTDNFLGEKFSSYQTVETQKIQTWSQPDKGLVGGTIKSVREDELTLSDFTGKEWTINISETVLKGKIDLYSGEMIKVIGQSFGDQIKASELRPWNGNMTRQGQSFNGMQNGNGPMYMNNGR